MSATSVRHVIVPGLPVVQGAFCHASVFNNIVWISGTIAAFPDVTTGGNKLIDGGVAEQTAVTLESIEKILNECGTSMQYITNLKIFLTNNNPQRYKQMNDAYVQFFKTRNLSVCSRITVGCSALALGADVEIDGSAVIPPRSRDINKVPLVANESKESISELNVDNMYNKNVPINNFNDCKKHFDALYDQIVFLQNKIEILTKTKTNAKTIEDIDQNVMDV